MESGNYAHINEQYLEVPIEKRKGTTVRPANPNWPQNYYNAILEAKKYYDIILTSMHWDLLRFFEDNKIEYYLIFPEKNLEQEYFERCKKRGNIDIFTNKMINNMSLWRDKLKNYKPKEIIYLKSGEYIEDILKSKNLI